MKKIISFCLFIVLAMTCMTAAVGAKSAEGKISPEVRALIAQNTDGGMVVEITYHNDQYPTEGVTEQEAVANTLAAQRELRESIEAVTYCEPSKLIFYNGTMLIGLPYGTIETVADLPNVDYIDLPHDDGSDLSVEQKMDDKLKIALEKLSADTEVDLNIWLAYNEHAYIGMAEPGDDCTQDEAQNYLSVMRAAKRDYISAKNEAFAQRIKDALRLEKVSYVSRYTPMISLTATLSEVKKLASLPEVGTLSFGGVVCIPDENPDSIEGKFAKWMYDTNGALKNDPALEAIGLQDVSHILYSNYREVCSGDGWTLVYATVNMYEPWEYVEHICLGNRVLSWYEPGACVIPYGYCVYNAKEDTFHPIERFVYPLEGAKEENGKYVKFILDPVISLDDYPGLTDALDAYNIGAVRGDADGDGEATIVDATLIQRYKADIIGATGLDVEAADADADNETTILDATRIQRTIADLCDINGDKRTD